MHSSSGYKAGEERHTLGLIYIVLQLLTSNILLTHTSVDQLAFLQIIADRVYAILTNYAKPDLFHVPPCRLSSGLLPKRAYCLVFSHHMMKQLRHRHHRHSPSPEASGQALRWKVCGLETLLAIHMLSSHTIARPSLQMEQLRRVEGGVGGWGV